MYVNTYIYSVIVSKTKIQTFVHMKLSKLKGFDEGQMILSPSHLQIWSPCPGSPENYWTVRCET